MSKHRNGSDARGALIVVCFMSLFQDGMGKDGYVRFVENNWMTPWVTVPLALLGLTLALLHFIFEDLVARRAERRYPYDTTQID